MNYGKVRRENHRRKIRAQQPEKQNVLPKVALAQILVFEVLQDLGVLREEKLIFDAEMSWYTQEIRENEILFSMRLNGKRRMGYQVYPG